MKRTRLLLLLSVALTALSFGCMGGDARVELRLADAMRKVAGELDVAVGEYSTDLRDVDDKRMKAVLRGYTDLIKADHADDELVAQHEAEVMKAVAKIVDDRDVEQQRFSATKDNIRLLFEAADGMENLAISTMTLSDEQRRYFGSLIEAKKRAKKGG